MRVIGAIIIILVLAIGIIPQFTDCLSQGGAIELPGGATIPMRCHWTRQAEVAVAIPLGVVGMAMVASRRRHTQRVLSIVTMSLGLAAVLLPTYLIGVCASEEMICVMVMKPTLILAGILTMAVGLVGLVYLRDDRT
ncbi:MAG: DUF4418 family protein [Anaerolineae bacterium]|nr:DUF4418 family protein [Anaerolineae bacterium]